MRKGRAFITMAFAAGLAAFTLTGCGGDSIPVVDKPGGLAVGDAAAPFALPDPEGRILRLSDVEKDWYLLLILYRGYWCSDCRNQMLDLKKDIARFTALRTAIMA